MIRLLLFITHPDRREVSVFDLSELDPVDRLYSQLTRTSGVLRTVTWKYQNILFYQKWFTTSRCGNPYKQFGFSVLNPKLKRKRPSGWSLSRSTGCGVRP